MSARDYAEKWLTEGGPLTVDNVRDILRGLLTALADMTRQRDDWEGRALAAEAAVEGYKRRAERAEAALSAAEAGDVSGHPDDATDASDGHTAPHTNYSDMSWWQRRSRYGR